MNIISKSAKSTSLPQKNEKIPILPPLFLQRTGCAPFSGGWLHPPRYIRFVFFGGLIASPAPPQGDVHPRFVTLPRDVLRPWWCRAVFRRNFRLLLPHLKADVTLRNEQSNLPPDFATLGYCRVLLLQNTIPQTPHFFIIN